MKQAAKAPTLPDIQQKTSGVTLQRQHTCSCGKPIAAGGECADCRRKRETRQLQRAAVNEAPVTEQAPPIVHDVLRSPGHPLDDSTRTFMESRFGQDFTDVRVHSDNRAAESARAVHAHAYTVGHDVVFGTGQYQTQTPSGLGLLAHELTHVVQQSNGGSLQRAGLSVGGSHDASEVEAEHAASSIVAGEKVQVQQQNRLSIQGAWSWRNAGIGAGIGGLVGALGFLAGPIGGLIGLGVGALVGGLIGGLTGSDAAPTADAQTAEAPSAQSIINLAQDQSRPIDQRAVEVVRLIIRAYFPSHSSLVHSIEYDEAQSGLETEYQGQGSSTTGLIRVGRYFVEHTTRSGLARRVNQVDHELEHVRQVRGGMAGRGRSDEREFLAFYRGALAPEAPGTGRISHATRVNLIDAALGYYYCFPAELQQQHRSRQQTLLERRQQEDGQAGNSTTTPPTSCRKASN